MTDETKTTTPPPGDDVEMRDIPVTTIDITGVKSALLGANGEILMIEKYGSAPVVVPPVESVVN